MARARREEAWEHTAWLAMTVRNSVVGLFGGQPLPASEFNPVLLAEREAEAGAQEARASKFQSDMRALEAILSKKKPVT